MKLRNANLLPFPYDEAAQQLADSMSQAEARFLDDLILTTPSGRKHLVEHMQKSLTEYLEKEIANARKSTEPLIAFDEHVEWAAKELRSHQTDPIMKLMFELTMYKNESRKLFIEAVAEADKMMKELSEFFTTLHAMVNVPDNYRQN